MDETPEQQPQAGLSSEARLELESRREEAAAVLGAGPHAGNRAGAFAFLALLTVVAAAVYYHFANQGVDSFRSRLDSQLRYHAELSVASMQSEAPIAVIPSWPVNLYHNLRRDIVVYGAFAALAAYFWSRSAAARARRDAFLLHDNLAGELARLRERVAKLDGAAPDASSRSDPANDRQDP